MQFFVLYEIIHFFKRLKRTKRRHTPEMAAACRLFGLEGRGTTSGRGTLYGGIPETVLSLVEKGFSPNLIRHIDRLIYVR